MPLSDDCWDNKATEAQIKASSKAQLDELGGPKNLPPLSSACFKGHLDIVRWLLAAGADVNKGDAQNRTPLWYATTNCPPKTRLSIVQELLSDSTIRIDAQPTDNVGNTPLMNAIKETRDPDVARLLVDRGADTKMPNKKNQTAETLAGKTEFAKVLRGSKGLLATLTATVFRAVALITYVVAWVNSKIPAVVNGVKQSVGVVQKYFNLSGSMEVTSKKDEEKTAEENIKKTVADPKNVTEMKAALDSYISDSGLSSFFKPGDPFIQRVAEKASNLRKDPHDALGTPDGIKRLSHLALYQPIIYCDDSGSMYSDTPTRYKTQCDLVDRIARIATKLAPDGCGVELRFINEPSTNKYMSSDIMDAMEKNGPNGSTPLGTSLHNKILKPLVHDVLDGGKTLDRPLLICAITDGCPDGDDNPTFKNAIVMCQAKLRQYKYDDLAVRYLISQIGEDTYAATFLRELTDDPQLEDVLHCMTQSNSLDADFKKLRANEKELDRWLLETLTAPIVNFE